MILRKRPATKASEGFNSQITLSVDKNRSDSPERGKNILPGSDMCPKKEQTIGLFSAVKRNKVTRLKARQQLSKQRCRLAYITQLMSAIWSTGLVQLARLK